MPPYRGKVKRQRYLLTTYGSPFVDAEPVRIHLKYLIEIRGERIPRISQRTGVPETRIRSVRTIQHGRLQRGMRRPDAAAILAYEPSEAELPGREGRVLGVRRVLWGLSAKGIPSSVFAKYAGLSVRAVDNYRVGTRVPCPETYAKYIAVGKRLECKTPRELGVSDRVAHQVASRAKRAGWLPLGMWDWESIHDPAAYPDWTGLCGTVWGYQAHRRQDSPCCVPCREARVQYRAEQREARRKRKAEEHE